MNDVITISPASFIRLRHFGDAPDVLGAVGLGEAQVAVEAVADVVAVEHEAGAALFDQPLLERVGDRGLARPAQARQPERHRPLAEQPARGPRTVTCPTWRVRLRSSQSVASTLRTGATRSITIPAPTVKLVMRVDHDEAAGLPVARVFVAEDRAEEAASRCGRSRSGASVSAGWRCSVLGSIRYLSSVNLPADGAGRVLDHILPVEPQRLLVHPDQHRLDIAARPTAGSPGCASMSPRLMSSSSSRQIVTDCGGKAYSTSSNPLHDPLDPRATCPTAARRPRRPLARPPTPPCPQ